MEICRTLGRKAVWLLDADSVDNVREARALLIKAIKQFNALGLVESSPLYQEADELLVALRKALREANRRLSPVDGSVD